MIFPLWNQLFLSSVSSTVSIKRTLPALSKVSSWHPGIRFDQNCPFCWDITQKLAQTGSGCGTRLGQQRRLSSPSQRYNEEKGRGWSFQKGQNTLTVDRKTDHNRPHSQSDSSDWRLVKPAFKHDRSFKLRPLHWTCSALEPLCVCLNVHYSIRMRQQVG